MWNMLARINNDCLICISWTSIYQSRSTSRLFFLYFFPPQFTSPPLWGLNSHSANSIQSVYFKMLLFIAYAFEILKGLFEFKKKKKFCRIYLIRFVSLSYLLTSIIREKCFEISIKTSSRNYSFEEIQYCSDIKFLYLNFYDYSLMYL